MVPIESYDWISCISQLSIQILGPYGKAESDKLRRLMKDHLEVKDKHVLVVGSQSPWMEMMALRLGRGIIKNQNGWSWNTKEYFHRKDIGSIDFSINQKTSVQELWFFHVGILTQWNFSLENWPLQARARNPSW